MIRFDNVSKQFKRRSVIADLNLEIEFGRLVALIGLSGCGKTITLKMINRLISPSSGRILMDGKDIAGMDVIKLRRSMGYVIQQTGLFPHMTVRQNIEIISRVEKRPPEEIAARTAELMDMVGLDSKEFLDRYPSQLSGGQQQRIGVARAFATNPSVILMDEPFSALDPISRSSLQDELADLQSTFRKTIVFVTHDMDEAVKIADVICVMHEGKIIQYDTPENLLKNPCNDFVADFVGKNRIWSSPEFIKASDIMITQPVTCRASMPLLQCMEIMRVREVDSLMVVDRFGRLTGMVKAKDIRRQKDRSLPAGEVLQQVNFTVKPESNLVDIVQVVDEQGISTIPVLDDAGRLVGLVTQSSLVTTLSQSILDSDNTFNKNSGEVAG